MSNKPEIQKFENVFRISSIRVEQGIKRKLDVLRTERLKVLEEIQEQFDSVEDAVFGLVAVDIKDNHMLDVIYVRTLVQRVRDINDQISDLEVTLGNLVFRDLLFYDMTYEDCERFGL